MRIAIRLLTLCVPVLALWTPGSAFASEFKCSGKTIKLARKASTWGKYQSSGSTVHLVKTNGKTMGKLRKSRDRWDIQKGSGSKVGFFERNNVYKSNGATWTSLSKAKSFAPGCPDHVAAGLWALDASRSL